jgi:His-Xaa-Ser system protein HxsD
MSRAGGAPGAGAEATDTGAIGAAEITLAFDRATVDLDALQRSAYAMAAEMTVDIRVCGADYVCTLFPRRQDATDDELKHRFRAEVNDQILRVRIAKETGPLRNLVFALAFSQTGLVEVEAEGSA